MAKNCLIYETLNGVKEMKVQKSGDLMTLTGVFGVCGVKNNNQRVYETSNYSKMVSEMQGRIKSEGGIPGELEHPSCMNITLENVSHKITDINIDENGVVTGSITLLNTPKGKIAQAIVEGGLPLFISSRATGNVDKTGNVCLERIATYDLVGTPGFSQAKLKLNENQVAESINESSIYYITEKVNDIEDEEINENEDMELKEILEKLGALEDRIMELEENNEELREQLEEANESKIDLKEFADKVQDWIIEEYSPVIQKWIVEEYSPEVENWIEEELREDIVEEAVQAANDHFINENANKIQDWILDEYSPVVEKWCKNELASGIQQWIVEEYSPEVENWVNESYNVKVQNQINESIESNKKNNLTAIDETLKVLESIEVSKPNYNSKVMIVENADEPKFIQEMPANQRVKWDMASQEVKESIIRRAKLYNFVNEGAIERFWNSINFEEVKPVKSIYEGLQTIEDEQERAIRASLRSWRSRR